MVRRVRRAQRGDRSGVRFALTLFVTALIGAAALVVGSAPSYAASAVQIDNVHFDSSTIEDGTRQALYVDWSIPGNATNPVSLDVDFPAGMIGYPDSFTMKGPGGEKAGTCTVTAAKISCTVDPAFITANPQGVAGSFWFDVRTDLNNTKTEDHTFEFGGQSVPVTVEPDSATCTTTCTFPGYKFKKYGTYNSLDNTITWTVRVPAPTDGIAEGKKITVTDNLDTGIFEQLNTYEGQSFPQVWEGRCLKVNSSNQEVPRWVDRTSGLTWNGDKTEVSFTSRAGTNSGSSCTTVTSGSFYQVLWVVKVKDLGQAGTYQNSATYSIEGESSGSTSGRATRHTGGGDVVGTDSGRFEVTKEFDGNTVLDPTFTVNYTAYDSTGAQTDAGSFDLAKGQSFVSKEYPRGTRIVLTEVKPTAPANVTWADPVFEYPAGTTAEQLEFTFSAANGNLGPDNFAQIKLINKATLKTGEYTASKVVVNDAGVPVTSLPASYRLNYSRESADRDLGIPGIVGGGVTLPADGTTVPLDVAAGVSYSFWESYIPAPAGTSWADPVYTVDGSVVEVDPVTGQLNLPPLPADAHIALVVTNKLTQDVGGFTITKGLSGDGTALIPVGTDFEVNYSYPSINGFPAGSGTVTVKAGETSSPITGIPAGAQVTLDEILQKDPVGGTWGVPTFDIGGAEGATFTVVKDQTIAVSLDNPISRNDGDFSVVKNVDGDGADLVAESTAFSVTYTYTLPADLGGGTGADTLTVLNDGTAVTSAPLPYGTTVVLAEATPPAISGALWTGASFDHETFTIGDKTTLAVTLTNTIERGVGSFSLVKEVTGSGKDLLPTGATFTVDYSYPAGPGFAAGRGVLQVKADGTAATSSPIPHGAKVTLSERKPTAVVGGTWSASHFDKSNFTISNGTVTRVTLTNTLDKKAAVGPGGQSNPDSGNLPGTGGSLWTTVFLPMALALLALGSLLLWAVRRRA